MDNYEMTIVEAAKEYVYQLLGNDSSGHDYYHSIRVYNTALKIAKNYSVKTFVLALAAILHDLDDYKISENTNHVKEFLDKHGLLEKSEIQDIINNMSFSAHLKGKTVNTIEGKIVQDADRLDALGAVGIARCFTYSGYKNRPMYKGQKDDDSSISHFYQKLFKLPELMNTTEAQEIALERVKFMNEFLKNFYNEWEWIMKEYSLKELSNGLNKGEWTSRDLVKMYLDEIDRIDKSGPKLNAISEINPDAYKLADLLDKERSDSGPRSILHGIPIVIKDNINTNDQMHTTASSYALKDFYAPKDAFIVNKLREAGMIILAKTNLSEFAYFMSNENMPSGYGSLNGQVKSPYSNKIDPLGSSTGSAVAVASNMIPVSIGTETNGSLMAPAQNNSIVSIKPTLGLVSRTGIIPISHLQDTAGPMARTIEDAAILLEILVGKDPEDNQTKKMPKKSYKFSKLYKKATADLTIAFLRFSNVKYSKEEVAIFEEARDLLKPKVAKIVSIELEIPDMLNYKTLIYDFKYNLNKYFDTNKKNLKIKSLKELIEFNIKNKDRCLKYGQSIFEAAEKTQGTLTEKEYLSERTQIERQANKFTALMEDNNIDVIVTPRRTSHAPVAGNPVVTVPAKALTDDKPISLFFVSKKFDDELCIRIAYQYEQLTKYRLSPNLETR